MLTILPIENKDEQEALCGACGIEYDPDALAYAARIDDVLAGVCQFRIQGDTAFISGLMPPTNTPDEGYDYEALFIMCRAAMRFAYDCFCVTMKAKKGVMPEKIARDTGFCECEDSTLTSSLISLYGGECRG
ncbi:MAG: hypothetical protein WBI55_04900 [Eubacteriales bacterium]|jgi:hypothetical protein|nr:hypothetical protein [Clostridiales bacterium]